MLLAFPSSIGALMSSIETNLCLIGPSRARPLTSSDSGSLVSTVVATMQTYWPAAETLCAFETARTWGRGGILKWIIHNPEKWGKIENLTKLKKFEFQIPNFQILKNSLFRSQTPQI